MEEAVIKGHSSIFEHLFTKIERHHNTEQKQNLKQQIVSLILKKYNTKGKNILALKDDKGSHKILELFSRHFNEFEELLPIIGFSIINLKAEPLLSFKIFFEDNRNKLESLSCIKDFIFKSAKSRQFSILMYLSEIYPEHIDTINKEGESPLYIVIDQIDFENFFKLWELTPTYRNSLTKNNHTTARRELYRTKKSIFFNFFL